MGKRVIWSKSSLKQLFKIHADVLKESDSLNIADKLLDDLLTSSEMLEDQPKLYPLDKYRKNNKGNYRAYEVHSYRISYREFKENIRIVRVRHTSRKPLKY